MGSFFKDLDVTSTAVKTNSIWTIRLKDIAFFVFESTKEKRKRTRDPLSSHHVSRRGWPGTCARRTPCPHVDAAGATLRARPDARAYASVFEQTNPFWHHVKYMMV